MTKPIVPMVEVPSFSHFALNETVLLKKKEEIEGFIELYEKKHIQSRKDTIECLGHFMFPTKEINGVGVFVSSCYTNHGPVDDNDIDFFAEDANVIVKTIKDMNAGNELFMDYHTFDYMDDHWLDFCKKGMKVIKNLRRFVDV